jgi:manganese-dependent inorganic pyrophosphatase
MIKVFGHISPDTDATGSAILWAWYLTHHTSTPAEAFVLGSLNKETKFVLDKWGIKEPALLETVGEGDEVVIVDTNNPEELLPNTQKAKIIQIIDHHRLIGGISTTNPISITMKPLASTASVVFELIGEHGVSLPNDMAGLLLSCILSDTLEFRSPTTTPHDKDIAERLAKQLGIDISMYASEMFKAKSDVADFTDIGLLHIDSKKASLGDTSIRISVVETTDAASILARKEGIVASIGKLLSEEKDVHDVLFFVIDILKEEATVFTYNDYTKSLIKSSFGVEVEGDTKVLPGVVSRKKQIIPALIDSGK